MEGAAPVGKETFVQEAAPKPATDSHQGPVRSGHTGVPPRLRRTTPGQQAKHGVERMLRRVGALGEFRLPSEDQLAEELGFSRPTIRSALLQLEAEGKVRRIHGVGTFINRHALTVDVNLAEEHSFVDILARLGRQVSLNVQRFGVDAVDSTLCGLAGDAASGSAVVIDRVFLGDGVPAVYSRDHIPLIHLNRPLAELSAMDSVFLFIEAATGIRVAYSVAHIRACVAQDEVAKLLELPVGTPILQLRHQHIGEYDTPVAYTESYVNQDVIEFAQIRSGGSL